LAYPSSEPHRGKSAGIQADYRAIDVLELLARLLLRASRARALGRMMAWKGVFQALASLVIVGTVQGPH